ncbi:hypothetical protein N9Y89_00105 [bacterium]|nr:hypothetical protein [bacterium]
MLVPLVYLTFKLKGDITRPSNTANPQGGIVKQEASIHISNLMVVDPTSRRKVNFDMVFHMHNQDLCISNDDIIYYGGHTGAFFKAFECR